MAVQPDAGDRPRHRIVVGVDGSEHSMRALRWALEDSSLRTARPQAVTALFVVKIIARFFRWRSLTTWKSILAASVPYVR